MKKTLFKCLVLLMVFLLLSATAFATKIERFGLDSYSAVSFDASADAYPSLTAALYAGQSIYVGEVRIEPLAGNNYRVTYFIPSASDWNFAEIHFEGISEGEMPFIGNNGGLIPGKFSVKMNLNTSDEVKLISFTYEGSMPLEFFAAHAVVYTNSEEGCIIQEETAWAGCLFAEGGNWSTYLPNSLLE